MSSTEGLCRRDIVDVDADVDRIDADVDVVDRDPVRRELNTQNAI